MVYTVDIISIWHSYSTGTGINGSKLPESELRTRAVYVAIFPWQPCYNYYISHLWLATNHEQSTHARWHHSNRGYKLEMAAWVNEMAETFACSLTVLVLLVQLSWKCWRLNHSSHWPTLTLLVSMSRHAHGCGSELALAVVVAVFSAITSYGNIVSCCCKNIL